MIIRKQALKLLHDNISSVNLRRHCYAAEAVMRALAGRLSGDSELWGIAGLVHDADYELTKNNPNEHTCLVAKWLLNLQAGDEIINAVLAHGWGYVEGSAKPKSKMEWALYCCDELAGFIVAVALVRPERRLSFVTVDSIMKKWNEKSFAAGVKRGQIEKCEQSLEIPLREFVSIALSAMQAKANDLGL